MTILYLGLVSADDIKQTSSPWVVEDKNELNFPSMKMTLYVYFMQEIFLDIGKFYGVSTLGNTLKSFFKIELSDVYFRAFLFGGKPLASKFLMASVRALCKSA
jgi:hypothetical protein